MRLYFPVDLTGNLIMIEMLVLGEIWTGDLPIFNPDALTSAPSWQARKERKSLHSARTFEFVLHFVRCVRVTVSPNQIIIIIIIISDSGSYRIMGYVIRRY